MLQVTKRHESRRGTFAIRRGLVGGSKRIMRGIWSKYYVFFERINNNGASNESCEDCVTTCLLVANNWIKISDPSIICMTEHCVPTKDNNKMNQAHIWSKG